MANHALKAFFPQHDHRGSHLTPEIGEWLPEQVQRLDEENLTVEQTRPHITEQEHGRLTLRVLRAQHDGFIVTTECYLTTVSHETLQSTFGLTGRKAEVLFGGRRPNLIRK